MKRFATVTISAATLALVLAAAPVIAGPGGNSGATNMQNNSQMSQGGMMGDQGGMGGQGGMMGAQGGMGGQGGMMQMMKMMQAMMQGGTMGPQGGMGGMMSGQGGMGGPGGMGGAFAAFDTDGDGTVSPEEARAGLQADLDKFDANADATLSLEEFAGLYALRMRADMVDDFQALDQNGDGKITSEEMLAPADRMNRGQQRCNATPDGAQGMGQGMDQDMDDDSATSMGANNS